ncbi:hypothetical protein BDK51DRAFT_40232 [Blyttiomyces helicus]|uniref:Uncharacterized protein n=1 Tax=Blyttiomyces helicus TaxID=388810 RepID=A0A4P9W9D4_9FUNG|nr:hypothetical protein BDK51DRAFT_40232 [Blyttiomyces helicus]|eukprot:RKO89159.1 hypothetical protein BDK51DRAFT_40232 [Blyttiomyces helicus]
MSTVSLYSNSSAQSNIPITVSAPIAIPTKVDMCARLGPKPGTLPISSSLGPKTSTIPIVARLGPKTSSTSLMSARLGPKPISASLGPKTSSTIPIFARLGPETSSTSLMSARLGPKLIKKALRNRLSRMSTPDPRGSPPPVILPTIADAFFRSVFTSESSSAEVISEL